MFVLGNTYRRRNLHQKYSGQRQGGISTPAQHPFLMIFTGDTGQQYGYKDGWSEEGLFLYTGEGQVGDMQFLRGNLAIRDHFANGKDLHLFEYVKTGYVRYIGQMVCTGFSERRAVDINGDDRKAIVFEFTPITAFERTIEADEQKEEEAIWQEPLMALRERAVASSSTARSPLERRSFVRYRSSSIRVYVLKRANGVCEACGEKAPFRTNADRPYLEPHHIRRLSDGGPDAPQWVIGVCPNCHRRSHYSQDKTEFNEKLTNIVKDKERRIEVQ